MSSKARGLADLGNAFDDGALSNRNMIINGGMVISQRYGAASQSPAPSGYGIDRWATYKSGAGTFSIQQSTDGPSGFSNSALITVTSNSTPSGGDYYIFQHPIEGYNMSQLDWGASGAKDVTLSFWVKSSVTGTFGGSLRSSTGNYSYVFEYTVNSSSTWEYKSVNISGATVDTWNSTNGSGINLLFSLGQGTTYATSTVGSWTAGNFHSLTTETDLIASAGATWQITGVQLEVGDTATPFEHRSYGDELARCKRYYHNNFNNQSSSTVRAGNGLDNRVSICTRFNNGELQTAPICFPTTMRTSGSVSYYRPSFISNLNRWAVYGPTGGWSAGLLVGGQIVSIDSLVVAMSGAAGVSDFQSFIVSGYFEVDAEL